MEEKRCLLCNKPYDYKYKMFGRGCLDNIYGVLDFHKPPKFVWNKEVYLCTKIAWKNHKYFLTKKKKYDLAQKYIAFKYLEKMNLGALFDLTKKNNPISYAVFYSMQYMFWQIIVIGGLFTNKPLSAKLLTNSLSVFGKEPNDLLIEDEKIKNILLKSPIFKKKLEQLIEKYGEGKNEFIVNEKSPREDTLIRFDDADLLYALHDATLLVKGTKDKNNKWNLEIEIKDTYDFTDFKELREYADEENNKMKDILSTTLNNLGVASSEYGVIKVYDVKIKFETKEGEF